LYPPAVAKRNRNPKSIPNHKAHMANKCQITKLRGRGQAPPLRSRKRWVTTLKGRTTGVFGIWPAGLPRTFQVLAMTSTVWAGTSPTGREISNPKHEIRTKFKARNTNAQRFRILDFDIWHLPLGLPRTFQVLAMTSTVWAGTSPAPTKPEALGHDFERSHLKLAIQSEGGRFWHLGIGISIVIWILIFGIRPMEIATHRDVQARSDVVGQHHPCVRALRPRISGRAQPVCIARWRLFYQATGVS
jgi:hypothetical protein